MLRKIAIVGPESTGKSTLCEQLAEHYQTLWCPEYAREYLLEHGMKYTYDDLLTIARGQVALEDKCVQLAIDNGQLASNRAYPLFIDTNMYVMKVWCEFVFGKCHQYILDQLAARKYDLYFLCNVDLPWTFDDLREYPDLETRQKLYEIYKDIMTNQTVPWVEISGGSENRFETAVRSVDTLLKD
ncbi:MAG: ATP-binding protein [Bacteroidetes bacterium]|nr:MAG: ATP-binding protein [Bacteroidota bacterium]